MVKIFLDEIYYFEPQKNYLLIYTVGGTFNAYHSPSKMEEKMPEPQFLRVHRSFMVNTKKMKGYTGQYVAINRVKIAIGRHDNLSVAQAIQKLSLQK